MDSLVRAFESLVDQLPTIGWTSLALALLVQIAKLAARSRAWRNVITEAYPDEGVPWRSVFAAYVAGVGANTLLPARSGELLRLFLVRRQFPGTSYPTLASTLAVESVFDLPVALLFVLWAVAIGALPGFDALERLPSVDWLWVFQEPRLAALLAGLALVLGFALGIWAARAGSALWIRLAQGIVILRRPRRYVRRVVLWQALDWALRLLAIALLLDAFGLPATVTNVVLVQATQSLATLLPLTPAGIGTEQALLVYVLGGEAGAAAILSFSVGMRLALGIVNVALASVVLLLIIRTLRWRRVVGAEEATGPAG